MICPICKTEVKDKDITHNFLLREDRLKPYDTNCDTFKNVFIPISLYQLSNIELIDNFIKLCAVIGEFSSRIWSHQFEEQIALGKRLIKFKEEFLSRLKI